MWAPRAWADPSLRRERWVRPAVVASAALGVALLVGILHGVGWTVVVEQARALAGILPAVLLLTGLKYPLQTMGWRVALSPGRRPPWIASISATVAGDALGYLTWAGPISGEPTRAMLARDHVPLTEGIAAGVLERGVYNATAALLVLAAWLYVANTVARGITLVIGGALVLLVLTRLRTRVRTTPGNRAKPAGDSTRERRSAPGVRALARTVKTMWRERRSALFVIVPLGVAQHLLLVAEAYLMLVALGASPTLGTALAFEGMTKVVNSVGTIVPGRLGVAEGGGAVLSAAAGYQASYGLGLALMRRIRALVWAAVGLALLVPREIGARRAERRRPLAPSDEDT